MINLIRLVVKDYLNYEFKKFFLIKDFTIWLCGF